MLLNIPYQNGLAKTKNHEILLIYKMVLMPYCLGMHAHAGMHGLDKSLYIKNMHNILCIYVCHIHNFAFAACTKLVFSVYVLLPLHAF